MDSIQELGPLLKQYREKAGISQKDFAERNDVKTTHLSAIENGKREVSFKLMKKLLLDLDLDLKVVINKIKK